jgi:hypothetical protein
MAAITFLAYVIGEWKTNLVVLFHKERVDILGGISLVLQLSKARRGVSHVCASFF